MRRENSISSDLATRLALLATLIACTPLSRAAPPAERWQDVRSAIRRSLPYVENVSKAWMQERKCNSCHNVTFLIWSHNLAVARGFDIDRKKLAAWTKWSLADSLSDRYWFKLRPRAMIALKVGGVAEPLLGELKPLEGKTYLTKMEYLGAIEKALGREDLEKYKDSLIKQAALPNNGGGPDTLSQLLLGRVGASQDESENESYAAIRSLLMQWQEPDGTWEAQGQLPAMKWGPKEMHEATTMWSILALSGANATDQSVNRSREYALMSLKNSKPGITIQSLALHVIIANKFGNKGQSDVLRKELLAGQRSDGGWAWVKENKTSDAFATGQALYALGLVGVGGDDPAVGRARNFLLRTQDKDGGWSVPQEAINKRRRGLNVYDYWGTAWATIGLLETLPPER